jgi:hypothetical protein
MKRSRLLSLLVVMLACGIAARAQVLAGPHRPATVPEGYLVTPMGYFHPSCVKEVARGDILRPDEMAIRHPNGSYAAMHVCAYSHFRADGQEVPLNPSEDTATAKGETVPLGSSKDARVEGPPPFIGHSWIEAIYAQTSSSYGAISTQFKVPPGPASSDGQTLYFFPGMQDYHHVKTILQPVLGWNSDFKNAWGIASWNCCTKGTLYKSPGERTATGHVIYGVMVNQCSAGTLSCGKWTINTKDLTSGAYSKLFNESNFGQTFNWGFGAVLEVYNVARCSDYPSGGKLTSYNVNFYDYKFKKIAAPTWYLWKVWLGPPARSPVCGYGGYLNTPSGSAMTLTY